MNMCHSLTPCSIWDSLLVLKMFLLSYFVGPIYKATARNFSTVGLEPGTSWFSMPVASFLWGSMCSLHINLSSWSINFSSFMLKPSNAVTAASLSLFSWVKTSKYNTAPCILTHTLVCGHSNHCTCTCDAVIRCYYNNTELSVSVISQQLLSSFPNCTL